MGRMISLAAVAAMFCGSSVAAQEKSSLPGDYPVTSDNSAVVSVGGLDLTLRSGYRGLTPGIFSSLLAQQQAASGIEFGGALVPEMSYKVGPKAYAFVDSGLPPRPYTFSGQRDPGCGIMAIFGVRLKM